MTQRLYYEDSHLTVFDATVLDSMVDGTGRTAVVLDRTAFYPTGGGQPSDVGEIERFRVIECIDDENRGILHVLEDGVAMNAGQKVTGRIDWEVRRDHIQQHTGQHILSQAFVKLFGAETRGFRMMEDASEIDVALEDPTDDKIERAVKLANEITWDDRQVIIHTAGPEEISRFPLRKDSEREGVLRIIEISDFDFSPCGGTHAKRTGEVGVIAVRSWERAKGMCRLTFLAGNRVLADYNRANTTARNVAAVFSSARDDAPAMTARMFDENKRLARHVRELEVIAAKAEADELLSNATTAGGLRVVAQVFEGRDAESLKRVAATLVSNSRTVALLGSREDDTARVVLARSADAPGDMNLLMKEACAALEGRGGGKPDLAQGGGKRVEELENVIRAAMKSLLDQHGAGPLVCEDL